LQQEGVSTLPASIFPVKIFPVRTALRMSHKVVSIAKKVIVCGCCMFKIYKVRLLR
jgi:hypothetical protein